MERHDRIYISKSAMATIFFDLVVTLRDSCGRRREGD